MKYYIFFILSALVLIVMPQQALANVSDEETLYSQYRESFANVHRVEEIEKNGFRIFRFDNVENEIEHSVLGKLEQIFAIHTEFNRLALFSIGQDGTVLFKTDQFECNSWLEGRAKQTVYGLSCIAYRDLTGNGKNDLIVIATCQNQSGRFAGRIYQVGDVLFESETGFHRDPRVSDKINRFDMNNDYLHIIAFVRDGISQEFLFTAQSMDELLAHGFYPIRYQQSTEHLTHFGTVDIVPGFNNMVGQNYLMIYLVDADGRIVWNFQPMLYYANLYAIVKISLADIDDDGVDDLIVLGLYVTYNEDGSSLIKRDYNIYYQRAGFFLEDTDIPYICGDEDTMDMIIEAARDYWRGQRHD